MSKKATAAQATPKQIVDKPTKAIVLRGAGLDCIGNLIKDGYMRPATINGEPFSSMVDLMVVFSEAKNPRQYWKDHKAKFIGNDEVGRQLVENLYQIKLLAPDGKMRETDVAPLWVCIFVAMRMNTPLGRKLAMEVSRFSAAEIKYRLYNVARGLEWAADSIHQEMLASGAEMTWAEDDDQPYKRGAK